MNTLKTTLLLGTLTGLLMAVGYAIGGQQGMGGMLLVSIVMNFGTWWFSDSIVLRTSGAVPINDPRLAWIEEDVAELAKAADMPKPRVFIVPHEGSPNAFATGRTPSKGVVAVTAGLINTLDRRQVRGVLAHELAHIRNRDTLTSAVAASIAGVLTYLSYWMMFSRNRDVHPALRMAVIFIAPLAAGIIRMAISRTREYAADAEAARISGDPEGLALALEGISRGASRVPMHGGNQATHYISNNFRGGLSKLMSTHPPIDERARRLRELKV